MTPAIPRPESGCLVTVCRGCCCGTRTKHPEVDPDAQLAALRERVGAHGRVRTSDCLGPCDRSTVVVVAPTPAARRAGARPAWLGFVLTDDAVTDIGRWVRSGGPGTAPMPAPLALHSVAPLRPPPLPRPPTARPPTAQPPTAQPPAAQPPAAQPPAAQPPAQPSTNRQLPPAGGIR